ncbi:hypothetical protein AKI39_21195 [Bordetella sp. H567]|nr:hypothetical protein AKI39_21195 [Bordetella sp. H567]
MPDHASVRALISRVFDYRPTAVHDLKGLAAALGVEALAVKDEGGRLGLRSFKALGGAYAVLRTVWHTARERGGASLGLDDLPRAGSGSLAPPMPGQRDQPGSFAFRRAASALTFVCATDGNHGQAVAAGARLVGAHAVVLVHQGVAERRRRAIARFGAEVRVVPGSYDDAVEQAGRLAQAEGWVLLSDTSWHDYLDVPRVVMEGYCLIAQEIVEQLDRPPTHVFLQAGVGGMAAALGASLTAMYGDAPPAILIVEPERAACFMASARAGRRVRVRPGHPTIMSMLECYEPSTLAWDVLDTLARAFITVSEAQCRQAMHLLAYPRDGDATIMGGESGVAGLAGLCALVQGGRARAALGLDSRSRVLVVNTESTDDEGHVGHTANG